MSCALLDSQWLKDTFLVGVDLTDDYGNTYPDAVFEQAIEAARLIIGTEVSMDLCEQTYTDEEHDLVFGDHGRAYQLQLNHAPITSVTAWKFGRGNNSYVTIPLDWIKKRFAEYGIVEIQYSSGSPVFQITHEYAYIMDHYFDARFPSFSRLTYTAGFNDQTLPADIKYLIGLQAIRLPLNIAGDLVGGAGLQGWSNSIDGLSQSVTTTNSSTNAGYGARILETAKEYKMLLGTVRAKYRGLPMHGL